MSATSQSTVKRNTIVDLAEKKAAGQPIVSLTAYTAPMAGLLDEHCDFLLVGDSLGMVMYGMDTTLAVTLDMMINHGKAVMRGSEKALVVIDLPFGTYEASPKQAFETSARVLAETGAAAVKLEGGARMAETIKFLVDRGIPVMAHIGLTPQAVNGLGGFRAQGREESQWQTFIDDAIAVDRAGAFATVLEGIAEPLAVKVTEKVSNITIGIGASAACDGQILVTDDMLGMLTRVPKFAKKYMDLRQHISTAVGQYATEVQARSFPAPENTFSMKKKS